MTIVPRQLRVEYPGAIYHVLSRGNRQQDIYRDDVDRQDCCLATGRKLEAQTQDSDVVLDMLRLQRMARAGADAWTLTKKRVFFIRIDFPDVPGSPYPQQELKDLLNGSVRYHGLGLVSRRPFSSAIS